MKIDSDSARVRIPPPLMLLTAILCGVGIRNFFPVPLLGRPLGYYFGVILILCSFAVLLGCASRFQKAKTNIKPWKTTSHIVTDGVYAHTRNPIYLSFVFVHLGIACVLDSAAVLLMAAPFVLALNFYVIRKEESYLSQKFGDEYNTYTRRVRRWF